ncbi:trypsin-like peptidase domain-containing protein [Candidatus Woesearchaeota archaeon]|nr:trypsin-like peptidase domain-containing protein [Candidatus Woesearchaeota archaeon]
MRLDAVIAFLGIGFAAIVISVVISAVVMDAQQQDIDKLASQLSASQLRARQEAAAAGLNAVARQEAQRGMVESELLNQELLIQSRLSSQNQRIDDQIRKLDKTDKSVKKLRNDLGRAEFMASDFSSTVEEALPAVVKITYNVTLTLAGPGNLSAIAVEELKAKLSKRGLRENTDYVVSGTTPYSHLPIIFTVFGSGSIVDNEGLVLTNRHVVDAGAEICDIFAPDYDCEISDAEVTAGDGRVFTGPLDALMSVTYDLAVFHTNLGGKKLRLGNSDSVVAGERVVAIGNPSPFFGDFPLDFTASQGIVSALNRNLDDGLGDFWMQTDTPLNPGNSGSPLLNKEGQMIGIVTSGFLFSDGLNFAIPSNVAKSEFGLG